MAATAPLAEWVAQGREDRKSNMSDDDCQFCKATQRSIKTLTWINGITASLLTVIIAVAVTFGTLSYRVQCQANGIANTKLQLSNQIAFVSLCLADNDRAIDKQLCDSYAKTFNDHLQNRIAEMEKTTQPRMPPLAEQLIPPVPAEHIILPPLVEQTNPPQSVRRISKPAHDTKPEPVSEPEPQARSRREKIVNNIVLVLGISAMLIVYFLLLYRLGKVD